MHEKHSRHETESLTVSSLGIQHCVRIQDVVESLLPFLQPAGEVGVGGERTAWRREAGRGREGRGKGEAGVGEGGRRRGEGRVGRY